MIEDELHIFFPQICYPEFKEKVMRYKTEIDDYLEKEKRSDLDCIFKPIFRFLVNPEDLNNYKHVLDLINKKHDSDFEDVFYKRLKGILPKTDRYIYFYNYLDNKTTLEVFKHKLSSIVNRDSDIKNHFYKLIFWSNFGYSKNIEKMLDTNIVKNYKQLFEENKIPLESEHDIMEFNFDNKNNIIKEFSFIDEYLSNTALFINSKNIDSHLSLLEDMFDMYELYNEREKSIIRDKMIHIFNEYIKLEDLNPWILNQIFVSCLFINAVNEEMIELLRARKT